MCLFFKEVVCRFFKEVVCRCFKDEGGGKSWKMHCGPSEHQARRRENKPETIDTQAEYIICASLFHVSGRGKESGNPLQNNLNTRLVAERLLSIRRVLRSGVVDSMMRLGQESEQCTVKIRAPFILA